MRRNPTLLTLWLLACGCQERVEVDDCQHLERDAPSLSAATQYVTDELRFPSSGDGNSYAYDVTGRGQPRNQFAALAAQLRLQPAVEELVQRGELALVLDVQSGAPGVEGAPARVRVSHAVQVAGARTVAISPPPSRLIGAIRGSQLSTTPPVEQRCSQSAQLAIQFGQEGIGMYLPIQAAHLSATLSGDELRDGEIHGVIRKRDWDQPSEGERRAAGLFGASYNAVNGRAWDDVWAVGDQELVAHYDGRAWSRLRRVDGSGLSLVAVLPDAAGDALWILGNDARGGHVFRWEAGALTERRATALPLRALHGAAADNLFAVGEGGLVLRFDGSEWRDDPGLRQVAAGSFFGLWAVGRDDVYAVGRASQIRRFDGAAWSPGSLAPLRESWTLRGAFGTGPLDLWVVGDRSEGGRTHAVVLHEGGAGFAAIEELQLPTSGSSLRAVFGSGPRDLWLAGETGLLMTLRP